MENWNDGKKGCWKNVSKSIQGSYWIFSLPRLPALLHCATAQAKAIQAGNIPFFQHSIHSNDN